MESSNLFIDKSWTLFLDRDGVINEEALGSYITKWDDFIFLDGVLKSLQSLNHLFGTIVVVSNQRGVGKGIMSLDALNDISHNMIKAVSIAGGRIDKAYACTAISDADHNRKPNTGMAQQAQQDFEDIDFKRSVMVGNSISDMEFGKRMGMHTVFLTTKLKPFELPNTLVDEQYSSLQLWADALAHAEMAG